MWIELSPLWIAVINCLGIPAAHLLIAWWSTLLPAGLFRPGAFLFRTRGWERSGAIYLRLFRLRSWKHLLPDGASWFSGFPKGKLKSTDPDYLRAFIVETCRGESSHWMQMVLIAGFIAWTPWPYSPVIIIYSVVSNLPCIVNLRYTRLRIGRVLGA